jgi:serine/threonine-protein kinase
LHIDGHYGRAQADAFLAAAKLDREYLNDETRPIPVEAWLRALLTFTSRWGRGELEKVVESHVHVENLGVWARVLRGSDNPTTAFRQLSQLGGEDVLTERWETLELRPRRWVGHVFVRADQAEERDGLCLLARAAELASIPMLFGMRKAKVHSETFRSSRPDTLEQRYTVTWGSSGIGAQYVLPVIAAVLGFTGAYVESLANLLVALFTSVGALVGLIAGIVLSQWRTRVLANAAQIVRLRALERSVALRETRERRDSLLIEGGVVAGQYRLGSKLGVGASGAVWEATRLSDGRVVAIKLLRAAVAHDTVAADRLRREAAALGLAWHPNVVEVYDDGHLPDGTSYLVMERLYGESLADRLRRVGQLAPEQLLPIALQVCDALGAVHAAGIVHRDLKPSNIFITRAPNNETSTINVSPFVERTKLLDFGIARVEWAETRLTNAGAPLGTPGYMSPEQEQGLEIDARSDLFSLGSILFECLTGKAPPMTSAEFRSEPRGPIPDSVIQLAFRDMPEKWRLVIERATDPLPRHRYPDARSLRDALVELANHEKHVKPQDETGINRPGSN